MAVCWYFYRFDYARYLALRPALRSATQPAAFAAIAEGAETEAIVTSLEEGTLTLSEARNAFVQAVCCLGDPLILERGLPRFVAALRRRRGAEDAAELLGELLTGGKNMETWLLPASGLIGFLTPEETQMLRNYYATVPRRGSLRWGTARRRGVRRGGLVGACVGFVARLFDRGPQLEEMLPLLGDLIEEAANASEGLAVVAA
ncbi:MAG TPA: hypothetical protein VFB38_23830 [Chthonomonadaceae bacterium]|nr:hypothetical protein [Chthonomonadaceae bacterium]